MSSTGADGSISDQFPELPSLVLLRPSWAARSPANAQCMRRGDDRLAFAQDNVRRVVLVLIVRFHHVEDHRLRLIAGGAPHTGEGLLQVTSNGGDVWNMGPLVTSGRTGAASLYRIADDFNARGISGSRRDVWDAKSVTSVLALHRAFYLILQPAALLLLPALFKSLLLVATNSRQLTNSMSAFASGGILSEYEFRFWHSTSQLSSPCAVPSNNVRITRSHFSLLSCSRCVKAAFRSSSLSARSISLGSFRAVACDEARAYNGIANSKRIIGAVSLESQQRGMGRSCTIERLFHWKRCPRNNAMQRSDFRSV